MGYRAGSLMLSQNSALRSACAMKAAAGGAARAELLTGIDGVSSRPVRRIVLLG